MARPSYGHRPPFYPTTTSERGVDVGMLRDTPQASLPGEPDSEGAHVAPSHEGQVSGQPENFLSWEQIKPLLKPGMTTREFAKAVISALRLPPGYSLQIMPEARDLPPHEAIRFGVRVFKTAELARYEVMPGPVA